MSPVRLRLAKIQFCNGKPETCNKCFCFCNCARTMHRVQLQQYQICADFNEHFQKVWTGDSNVNLRISFILFIRRSVKPALLSCEIQFFMKDLVIRFCQERTE